MFLDDFTVRQVSDALQVPIDIVKSSGQEDVYKRQEQINTARMNDEHYDNRLNTVQSEIGRASCRERV